MKNQNKYFQKVNTRSRKAMVEFLENHFRYDTMNSWNNSTSYANKVKVSSCIPAEYQSKVYEMMEAEGFYDNLNWLLEDFDMQHDYRFQVGFNGRSGGYIVLYEGFKEEKIIFTFENTDSYNGRDYADGYGWMDIAEAKEKGLYKKKIYKTGTWSGRSIDQREDFSEWDMDSLKSRVKLVQELDRLCDDIVAQTISMAKETTVQEESYTVIKTRKVLATA